MEQYAQGRKETKHCTDKCLNSDGSNLSFHHQLDETSERNYVLVLDPAFPILLVGVTPWSDWRLKARHAWTRVSRRFTQERDIGEVLNKESQVQISEA